MATLDICDVNREKISQVEVSDRVFDTVVKEHLYYDVIKMQLANSRRGTASTKNRSEVRGGGKKPWRQKGTGRARAGTIRSPLWKGGGCVFGPKPRDYSIKVTKKVKKQALCSALTMKLKQGKLFVLEKIELQEIKTKALENILKGLGVTRALIIDEDNLNLEMSARNIPYVKVSVPEGLNLYDVLYYDELYITQPCLEKIQRRLEQ